jgi:cytoskeletal protein CcmA (bactofilin family)
MFSKPAKASSPRLETSETTPARKPIAASLIAENVTLAGDLTSDGDVQLDGHVRGDVKVGRLTIGETGQVDGAIEAETVDIRGRITGSASARQIRLYATAAVQGDLTHAQLTIDSGAQFQGRSLRFEPPTAVAEPVAVVAEAAE